MSNSAIQELEQIALRLQKIREENYITSRLEIANKLTEVRSLLQSQLALQGRLSALNEIEQELEDFAIRNNL